MLLVADESVDFGLIRSLRLHDVMVISILEEHSGKSDLDVLEIAVKNGCLLVTEDKDFGELTYRLNRKHFGILLIRLNDVPRETRILLGAEAVLTYFSELRNSFSVLTSRGLRIKKDRAED